MADIVVGYDGSECSQAALDLAAAAAAALGDKIVVAFGYDANPVGGELLDYAKSLHELGEQRTSEGAERARASGADVETVVISGSPAQALADLADQRDARMIVVGTYSESPIKGAILGSTPHKLLHLASRPVLVVPLPD
jgi:nucleotide-binding universal stress UspA family protein